VHWFTGNQPDRQHMHFDLIPEASELELRTDLRTSKGQLELFSDQNPKAVLTQFQWMRDYGVDAAAMERFVVGIGPKAPVGQPPEWANKVLQNSLTAADSTDVGLFVMYDIASAKKATWAKLILDDWKSLLEAARLEHRSYQRHGGRPVLAIAGIGADSRPGALEKQSNGSENCVS
jgi:hypothetical protein